MWIHKRDKSGNGPNSLHHSCEHRAQILKDKHLKETKSIIKTPEETSGFSFLTESKWNIQKPIPVSIDLIPMI